MGNVLFLALDTYSRVGGLQQFNRRVIKNLVELEAKGVVAHAHIMRDKSSDIPEAFQPVVSPFGDDHTRFITQALLRNWTTDILLVGHVNLLPVAALMRLLNPRMKVILFVHGDEVWNDPVYRLKKWYEPALLRLVTQVASVSYYTADVMSVQFSLPRSRFTVFPNAVDPLTSVPTSAEHRSKEVLVVTRLAEHDHGKHIDSVIRAFGLLLEEQPDAILTIVGDGVLRQSLQDLASELGITTQVRFLGRVSDAALAEAYGRACCFVMPSSKEGFGIVYLEAWQRGIPVICGTEGASKEIISDGVDGFVVKPRDIEALADKMSFFTKNPWGAAEMGRLGRQKVESKYLNANFNENLLLLLESVQL